MTDELEIVRLIQSRRNHKNIILAISTLIFGLIVDFFIFKQETVTTAYVPFMIMVGYLSRYVITNLVIAGATALLLQINPKGSWFIGNLLSEMGRIFFNRHLNQVDDGY
jgi:hypothetical protein